MSSPELREEVLWLARELIRIDTSNPPGNETSAAELLAGYLSDAGVECELAGPDPKRLNLIARLSGGGGPSLMMLAHTDVVPAPDANWTVEPFGADVIDGKLYGRGSTDMKNELAARAVALARAARSGGQPGGDVVLVAEADEERNTAHVGMSWLAQERPDIRCDYALNEGGGLALELADGRQAVIVSVGEKQVGSLRVRVFGRAAHASVPASADNPLRYAAWAVERLLDCQAPLVLTPGIEYALEALGLTGDGAPGAVGRSDRSAEEALEAAGRLHPVLGEKLPAMTRLTVTPTGLRTHEPTNVIPPFADVICDCRILPQQSEADIHEHVDGALGGDFRYELELLEPLEGGIESPIDTPLYRVCEDYVAERLPGALLLPVVTPGFTDSHWIRRAHGTVAYGFAPVFHTDPGDYMRSAHGADEHIAIDDLVEMAEFHLHAIRALPGST